MQASILAMAILGECVSLLGKYMNIQASSRSFRTSSWLLIAALWIWMFPAWSQPEIIRFKRLTDEEGLPNNLFRTIMQDRQGIIWMAGLDGIARYDGYTITALGHSHKDTTSISGNNILAIFEDSKNRLWVGTLGAGISISDATKNSFRKIELPLEENKNQITSIHAFTEDREGNIWIGSQLGLFIASEKDNQFNIRPFKEFAREHNLTTEIGNPGTMLTDKEGKVWIGTSKGLYLYDPAKEKILGPENFAPVPQHTIQDLNIDREGRIWLSCSSHGARLFYSSIYQVDFHPFVGIPFGSSSHDLNFTFDLDNRIWTALFSYEACAFDFRDSTLFFRSKVNSNINLERFFRKPFVDNAGNVWYPVEGFNIYPYPKGFKQYLHSFPFHQSNTCIFGLDSLLYVGYREKGMVIVNKNSGHEIHLSKNEDQTLAADHLAHIISVRSGNLIVVAFGNVSVLTPQGKLLKSYGIGGTTRSAFQDSKGRIWIGGYYGLNLFSEEKGFIKRYTLPNNDSIDGQFIQTVVEDKRGRIWFASDLRGLSMLEPETGKITQFLPKEDDPNSLPSISVLDIAMDNDDMMWLATDAGIVHFDPDALTFKTYNSNDGLESDFISAILCTKDGMVWVSTHAGISSFNPMQQTFTNYNKADGLCNSSYYRRSKFDDGKGTIYFGGKNGVDYFRPSDLRKNPTPPRLFISNLFLNNQQELNPPESSDEILKLSYKDRLLEIELAALHYGEQSELRYEYKLEGVTDDWVQLGNERKVLFSGLRPGDYVFVGKVTSGDGVVSKDEISIPIHIAPPFYLTRWFQITGSCLLLLSLFTFIKGREHSIKKKEKKEAEFSRKMAELEKRALQAQMNPHFIYNSMNSIQQFMILHDIEGAMKYLTKFSRILRTVLTISSQNRIPLYDEIKLIEDYLELENMRFPDKFTYVIQVSPECNIHALEIPPFFIQPQVENAIRHGLLRKPTPGHLRIEISASENHLHVTVEDDGIGREAAKAAKKKSGIVEESKALGILQERLAHLHSNNNFKPFKIIDLYDNNHHPAGTRVEITLPLD